MKDDHTNSRRMSSRGDCPADIHIEDASRRAGVLAIAAVIVLGTLGSLGASGSERTDGASRQSLEQRVLEYWSARKDSDLGAAYGFYAPSFRAQVARRDFLRNYQRLVRFPPETVAIAAVDMAAPGLTAAVSVRIELTRTFEGHAIPISTLANETWVLEDGLWWKKDEPMTLNF